MAWYQRRRGGYSSTGNTCKESGSLECDCAGAHLGIQVLCIYMTHLETVSIRYWVKRPVVEQLLQDGLLPIATLRPTLVIDILLLEWATTLFVHMSLTVHDWTLQNAIIIQSECH